MLRVFSRIAGMNKGLGAVFTPEKWAEWLIKKGNIHKKWADGAVILEPTAGEGAFLTALFSIAHKEKLPITTEMLNKLYIIEQQDKSLQILKDNIENRFHIRLMEKQLFSGDILDWQKKIKFDIIFGNLPWLNFTDLPEDQKEIYKKHFITYGLSSNIKDLLLGGSRIDLAALITVKLVKDNLKKTGELYLYLPLSLFFNEGAHNQFRRLMIAEQIYTETIWDLTEKKIFKGVGTRYGAVHLNRKSGQESRIFNMASDEKNNKPININSDGSPFRIIDDKYPEEIPVISISPKNKARQGINCCGANSLFHFTRIIPSGKGKVKARNGLNKTFILPEDLFYPLVDSYDFDSAKTTEHKYIFLPYNPENGKPFTMEQLKDKYPDALLYLEKYKKQLNSRKGVFLGTWIKRGIWWALLGAGNYSFSPWKIGWEAYGKKHFKPVLLHTRPLYPGGPEALLQPNQALHAFFPFNSQQEAQIVLKEISNEKIESYLNSFGTAGTCSWAQPGKINKICRFTE